MTQIRGSRKSKNMKKSGQLRQSSTSHTRRPDNSHLCNENRAAGNDQTLLKHFRYNIDVNNFSSNEGVAQTLHEADMMVQKDRKLSNEVVEMSDRYY